MGRPSAGTRFPRGCGRPARAQLVSRGSLVGRSMHRPKDRAAASKIDFSRLGRVMDDSSQLIGKTHPGSLIPAPLKDPLPMVMYVPTAPHRPGDLPRFSHLEHQPGDLPCPDTLASHDELRGHASGLIRVLGDDSAAGGPWRPALSAQQLRSGLEIMLRTRHFDARMIAMQRQGRLAFYVSSKGEEATAVAATMAYASHDMLFP